jgi:hypothetical protein
MNRKRIAVWLPRYLRLAAVPAAAFVSMLAARRDARAQDIFEIQVYEYKTVPPGRWNLETSGRG